MVNRKHQLTLKENELMSISSNEKEERLPGTGRALLRVHRGPICRHHPQELSVGLPFVHWRSTPRLWYQHPLRSRRQLGKAISIFLKWGIHLKGLTLPTIIWYDMSRIGGSVEFKSTFRREHSPKVGSITVHLTSYLTGLDLTTQVNLI